MIIQANARSPSLAVLNTLVDMKFVSLSQIAETGVSHNPEIRKKVILKKGDVPHVTNFSRSELTPGQRASSHAHDDMFEVFMVHSGVGMIKIEGASREFREGDCAVIEPGEEHEILNSSELPLVLIYFGIER